jgi:hypothetical protein
MGLDHTIAFPAQATLSWPAVQERLTAHGLKTTLMMIDQLPAMPDEVPHEYWKELRLGFDPGMVTVRRETNTIHVIVWGTAGQELLQARDTLAEILTELGQGTANDS